MASQGTTLILNLTPVDFCLSRTHQRLRILNPILFQIATDASGRGVLRLLLLGQRINLLAIPALCILLFTTGDPSQNMPNMLCILVRILIILVAANRVVSEPTVALGRYVYIFIYWVKRSLHNIFLYL